MSDADRIEALAAQYSAAMPDLDPRLQQAALALLRFLAQGEPVEVQRLAARRRAVDRPASRHVRAQPRRCVPTRRAHEPRQLRRRPRGDERRQLARRKVMRR